MTPVDASKRMAAHYTEHHCGENGTTGCDVAVQNYATFLRAIATRDGFDPMDLPGVRAAASHEDRVKWRLAHGYDEHGNAKP